MNTKHPAEFLEAMPLLVAVGLAVACGGESGKGGSSGQSTGGSGGTAGQASAGAGAGGAAGSASGKGGMAGAGATAGGGAGAGSAGTSTAGTGGAVEAGGVCDDYVAPAATSMPCRSDAECDKPGQYCTPPGATGNYCGTCQTPSRDCETTDDCSAGFVCVELELTCPCGSTAGGSSQCRAACDAKSCGEGNRCNARGLCEPTPCDDGYACADGFSCDATAVIKDAHGCAAVRCEEGFACPVNTRCSAKAAGHGCAPLACETDANCDCGACVLKACASGPGVCTAAVG